MIGRTFFIAILFAAVALTASAQRSQPRRPKPKAPAPAVAKLDVDGLRRLLQPDGKPRLINFWATWCDPCREEFPDLVKLSTDYKGKIDFVTVSLDDVEDISTAVPRFLVKMRSTMPAFLLSTADESEAISAISADYHGSLPFTILIKPSGEFAYTREGRLRADTVKAEIDKLLNP